MNRVGRLADVIAPPYDVIDDVLSEQLHAKSPYNVIRLILNPIRPTDTDFDNRYTRSARTLADWTSDGVLTEEAVPCLYLYSQTYEVDGKSLTRRGVLAQVRLQRFGAGAIYPHEETLPGPKADRLKLFHATGMNLSPVFGLFPDPKNDVIACLEAGARGKRPIEGVDQFGVMHQLSPVSNPLVLNELCGMMAPLPVFIADGHHRYETGIAHLENRMVAGLASGSEDPANFVLMMLVGMNEPGLVVLPTHRLVSGLGDMTAELLQERLRDHFQLEIVGRGESGGRDAWNRIQRSGRQEIIGFCTRSDDTWTLATLKSRAAMDALVKDRSAHWRSLAVAILHRLVLEQCLANVGQQKYEYVHLLDEVFDATRTARCDLACLVQPATVEHLQQLAKNHERMPPKSTYFYPKLASGLVFNAIR